MYRPIKAPISRNMKRFASVTPVKGVNLRQYSALLKPEYALRIYNYIPNGDGSLDMRKGRETILDVGTTPLDFFIRFTSTTFVLAYGTTVSYYDETTGIVTPIKTDFSANDGFMGVRYGEYFFVVNGVDKMWRIDTSFTATEVAASPVMTQIYVIDNRLAGVLASDPTVLQYSEVDDYSNPPFDAWNTGTSATDGGRVGYRNAGNINSVQLLGNNYIVFCDYGKWGFYIDLQDSGGTIKKIDQTVFSNQDLGGFASIVTEKGVFYVNEGAIMNLVSVGQPNIPYSKQEDNPSYILGDTIFDNLNFSGSAVAYDLKNKFLYISGKSSNSIVNNRFIVYNTNTKAFSYISNWDVGTFYTDSDNTLYGTSSSSGKVYKLFTGYTDDGVPIGTEVYQELTQIGDYNTAKDLIKIMAQCSLSPSSEVTFSFDIWDYYNQFQANVHSYCMTLQNQPLDPDGYGEVSYGSGGYGGNPDPSDPTIGAYDTYKPMIRNFQRIFLRITSSAIVPHTINLFQAEIKEKSFIRIRNIVECS